MTIGKQIPRAAVADLVYDELKSRIIELQFRPGERLIERSLAAELGVSVTPVREALMRLVQQGFAESALARGIWVHRFTPEEIADVFEMRSILESEALLQSAPQTSDEEWQALSDLLVEAADLKGAADHDALAEVNASFHAGLRKHCQNRMLADMIARLSERHTLISRLTWSADRHRKNELAEHLAILEHAQSGNVEHAAELLREHIMAFRDRAVEIARQKAD